MLDHGEETCSITTPEASVIPVQAGHLEHRATDGQLSSHAVSTDQARKEDDSARFRSTSLEHQDNVSLFTLSASKYSPPKRSSKPAINVPTPYLPLRKRASAELRRRASGEPQDNPQEHETDDQQSLAQMARSLRPVITRWSGESSIGQAEPQTLLEPPSASSQRPHTAHDSFADTDTDTLSPLARPLTSSLDYVSPTLGRNARGNPANSDPLPGSSPSQRLSSTTASPPLPANFWRDGGAAALRESILSSTATDASSIANTSSTSIWTARSSRTTYDSPTDRYSKVSDDDLSADDFIAMYAEGFGDDDLRKRSLRRSIQPPVPPLPQDPDKLSSPKIETRSEPLSTAPAESPVATVTSTSTRSDDTVTDSIRSPLGNTFPVGAQAQRRPQKIVRDFYGFKQESQYVTQNRYRVWHKDYQKHLERRKKKWVYLMNSNGLPNQRYPENFPPRSQEVKRFIRKGVPPEWRGAAWFFYGDGAAFLSAHPGLYDKLVEQCEAGHIPEHYRDMIERDLNRTFPDNIYFKPDPPSIISESNEPVTPPEPDMIKSLRRILQAFAVYHPTVGYCQSLNFLAGLLLLFMRLSFRSGNYEERAFALLCILTEKYLPGTHGVVLEGCNVDIGVLMTILQETMPAIWNKLDNNSRNSLTTSGRKSSRTSATLRTGTEDLPTVSLATTAWFMSCFVGTLPIESVCRVWDCLWYEGSKTIFRVALAIFKLGETQIKGSTDPSEVFQIVQTLPRGLLDANELMKVATMKSDGVRSRLGAGTPGFGGLSEKTVETRREERRAYAKGLRGSQEVSSPIGASTPPVPEVPSPLSPGGGLKRSKTRGTLRRLKSMRRVVPHVS